MEKRLKVLKNEFYKHFGDDGQKIRIFLAPGRVNLIGEHTDYNGGFVLPVAIDRNIIVAASPNRENVLRLQSLNFDNTAIYNLNEIKYEAKDRWANYPKGVAKLLQEKGYRIQGMDLLFEGNIPIGSGLSSSAAIEVVSCLTITTLSDIEIDKKEIPILCQKVENEFIGMRCGIMDQFVITFAKQGMALFLDCRNLEYEHIPVSSSDVAIIITDTRKKRKLIDSEYNTRRRQCEEGVKILKQYITGIKQLRDITPEQFERYKNKLPSTVCKRCEHIVYENDRVIRAKELLKNNKIQEFGNLMYESHESLNKLFQVSCFKLDTIVKITENIKGVIGSKMTGAGFGGCVVSLVNKESRDTFVENVSEKYQKKFKIKPDFYICNVEDGVKEINN